MDKLKPNILIVITTVAVATAQSIPEQEYLREQQALQTSAAFGCFLVLLFMAAVIVLPILLCIMIIVMYARKRGGG